MSLLGDSVTSNGAAVLGQRTRVLYGTLCGGKGFAAGDRARQRPPGKGRFFRLALLSGCPDRWNAVRVCAGILAWDARVASGAKSRRIRQTAAIQPMRGTSF